MKMQLVIGCLLALSSTCVIACGASPDASIEEGSQDEATAENDDALVTEGFCVSGDCKAWDNLRATVYFYGGTAIAYCYAYRHKTDFALKAEVIDVTAYSTMVGENSKSGSNQIQVWAKAGAHIGHSYRARCTAFVPTWDSVIPTAVYASYKKRF